MVIYSVKVSPAPEIVEDWLAWMQHTHIPEVIQHKGFVSYKMFKMEANTPTFRIDYYLESMEDYLHYQQHHAPALQASHTARYAGKFSAERSVGELIFS